MQNFKKAKHFYNVSAKIKYVSKFGLVLYLFAVLSFQLSAQTKPLINSTLKGKVVDANTKESLPGALVQIDGVTNQTQTDSNGEFILVTGQSFPYTIIVSYIGYEKSVVKVDGSPFTVELKEDNRKLNEIVVVGYSQKKRSNITSAITEVKGDKLANNSGTSFTEKLQGLAPGLQISSASGVEGGAALVRLRGATSINANNDPLYIIDGVFINSQSLQSVGAGGQTSNPLADINPADIESLEILKDANATAIYGSRGANGVIIITTKRGKKGKKTEINFNSNFGIATVPKIWDLVSGPEHALILNEQWINDGGAFEARPYRPTSEGGQGNPEDQGTYDRLGIIFRTANQTVNNLSITGGDNNTSFYVSGEITKSPSILKLQDFNRTSFRTNLDHNITKTLQIGTSLSYSNINRRIVPTGDTGGITNTGLHTPTLTPIFNADGSYNRAERFNNPYVLLENSNSHAYTKRFIGNGFVKWDILKNLSFKSSFSLDDNSYNEVIYYNANLNEGRSANGSATTALTSERIWIAEQLLSYIPVSNNEHFLSFFLGNTLQKNEFNRSTINGTNFPSTQFSSISSAAITTGSTTGILPSALISYFGGLNYSYKDRYILDANLRTDASSRFGANNRWATFPSVGLAWRVSKEDFFKDRFSFVDDVLIKSSLGWSGNQGIPDFASLGLWTGGNNYLGSPGVSPSQLGNEDLKWETTRQWNIGLETSFLKKRLSLSLDFYNKYTTDLLLQVPVPAKTGFSSVFQNLGEMSNKGFEVQVNTVNIQTKDFQWSTTFNVSHNKNKIEKLKKAFTQYNRDWVRLEEGYPLYSFWLYKQLYVDPQTGNAVYDDSRTKDGKITVDDRQIVGDAWPAYQGGFNNTLRYKGIDFSFYFYFSQGNKVFNMNRYFQEHAGSRGTSWSMLQSMMDRWQKPGDITDIPRVTTKANSDGSFNHNYESSRFLEDGSFIRLKSVSLGYTLPQSIIAKQKVLKKLKLYTNVTNLLTFTKYSGPDPEVNVAQRQAGATVQGLDFSMPPHPRTIQFGINATF
nr:TonB-dependent receptor [Pedobacter panaciterrae]